MKPGEDAGEFRRQPTPGGKAAADEGRGADEARAMHQGGVDETPRTPAQPGQGHLRTEEQESRPEAILIRALLKVDTVFAFLSGGQVAEVADGKMITARPFSRPGACRIRIFEQSDGATVVIATDLDAENPGMSVTNAAEDIAAQVCLRYGLDPERLIFVEHYDDRFQGVLHGSLVEGKGRSFGREKGESFDWVTFPKRRGWEFGEPHWKHAGKVQVESLIGQKLL